MDSLEGSIYSKGLGRNKEENWSTFLQGPIKAENLQCELIASATNTAAPRCIQAFLLCLQQGCHLAILVGTSASFCLTWLDTPWDRDCALSAF